MKVEVITEFFTQRREEPKFCNQDLMIDPKGHPECSRRIHNALVTRESFDFAQDDKLATYPLLKTFRETLLPYSLSYWRR